MKWTMWPSGTHWRRSQGRNIGVWRSMLTKRAGMEHRSTSPPFVQNIFKNLSPLKSDRLLVRELTLFRALCYVPRHYCRHGLVSEPTCACAEPPLAGGEHLHG